MPVLGGATRWASEAVVRVGGHRGVLLQRQETQLEQHSPRNDRSETAARAETELKQTPRAETETTQKLQTDMQKLQTRCSQTSGQSAPEA